MAWIVEVRLALEFSLDILEMSFGMEGKHSALAIHCKFFGVGDQFGGIDNPDGQAIDGAEDLQKLLTTQRT